MLFGRIASFNLIYAIKNDTNAYLKTCIIDKWEFDTCLL